MKKEIIILKKEKVNNYRKKESRFSAQTRSNNGHLNTCTPLCLSLWQQPYLTVTSGKAPISACQFVHPSWKLNYKNKTDICIIITNQSPSSVLGVKPQTRTSHTVSRVLIKQPLLLSNVFDLSQQYRNRNRTSPAVGPYSCP